MSHRLQGLVSHRRLQCNGFSLVDVVVGIALLVILFFSLFGILRTSLTLSTFTKAQAAADELASGQMEYLHGLSYDVLGTVGGIPAGTVPQVATSTVDGVSYAIRTYVTYYDDPIDGIGTNDTNHITTDYKIGKVTVSYTIYGLAKSVMLITNLVPYGMEASTNGGTLALHIVDATGADLPNATVKITNVSTSPPIDFTTFSNTSGMVSIDGTPPSSEYQILVSRIGYSSAQTYARAGENQNPTPGYLTVSKNQTTSATFAIDRLATLTLSSLSPAVTDSFNDTFATSGNLSSQTNTHVTGGGLVLDDGTLSGSAHSISFSPNYLDGWGILSATIATTTGTSVVVRVDDTSGTPLPDTVLPGNSAGFSSFPVSLTGVASSSYPGLSLEADLLSNSTTTTPTLLDWSLSHTTGSTPLPNTSFTLTGTKTIGTTSGGQPLYKTTIADTTGTSAIKTESLEWDTYTLSVGSANLLESCMPSPYNLIPAEATSTTLLIGSPTTNTLALQIVDGSGVPIPDAKVILTTTDYAATMPVSACGLAYFNDLSATTYTATVSAPGHTTKVFTAIAVSGHTPTKILTLP